MHEAVSSAVKVAPADVPVLVTGPNGSGKEKLAEIIQANSRRAGKPFVKVNAGGLHDNLVDAELFGAEAGAFTGATRTRVGRFEEAHGGTLLLDEIGNLSTNAQMKLLRVLQTGELQRLGSNVTRRVDVRVVSATNADLPRAIAEGTFREDLYFRLNVIEIKVGRLQDRREDVIPLARHFLVREADREGQGAVTFSEEALTALLSYDWPGNVRELENRVKRAFLVRTSEVVTAVDLGLSSLSMAPRDASAAANSRDREERNAEQAEIEAALVASGGIVSRAAAQLGMSRQALYRRMERLGIEMERRPKA
jgi:DNA-binding NtrC family response regulator